jgi:hypothetical protein
MTSTSPAVENGRQPVVLAVGLAATGGLFLGLLAAFGMVELRRRSKAADDEVPEVVPNDESVLSPNGGV